MDIYQKFEVGPFTFHTIEIPKLNLLNLGLQTAFFTLLMPFITTFLKNNNLPKIFLYLLFIIYALVLFYFFGIVTITLIVLQNVKSITKKTVDTVQTTVEKVI